MENLNTNSTGSFSVRERAALVQCIYLRDWRIGFVDHGNSEYACIFQCSANDPADWVVSKVDRMSSLRGITKDKRSFDATSVDGLAAGLASKKRLVAEMIDLEIYRSARMLLNVYGDDAAFQAAERAEKLRLAGDQRRMGDLAGRDQRRRQAGRAIRIQIARSIPVCPSRFSPKSSN